MYMTKQNTPNIPKNRLDRSGFQCTHTCLIHSEWVLFLSSYQTVTVLLSFPSDQNHLPKGFPIYNVCLCFFTKRIKVLFLSWTAPVRIARSSKNSNQSKSSFCFCHSWIILSKTVQKQWGASAFMSLFQNIHLRSRPHLMKIHRWLV